MTEINNCENCHHYNSLIHWEEGLFYQCMMGNKLWEKCNDYDAIKELERMRMYRVMDLSISKTYAWFYDLTEAEDYLKELGLGDKGVIDEVEVDVKGWIVTKRNCRSRS